MIYADEQFYKDKYLLGRKPVINDGFQFYSRQASLLMDQYTFGRITDQDSAQETVKLCCCELSESIFKQEKQQNASGGKTSEKNGTYSVSFSDAGTTETEKRKEQSQIIYKWLANTGLIYQGV